MLTAPQLDLADYKSHGVDFQFYISGKIRFQFLVSLCVCLPVRAGADKHGQAGPGAPSAVVRRGRGGGEMGGAGTRRCPTEPEPGQHGPQHVPVHQVTQQRRADAHTCSDCISGINVVKPLSSHMNLFRGLQVMRFSSS